VRYRDADAFCEALGVNHFGAAGIGEALRTCWERWARAFAFFPFTTKFLYFGPVNAAPSRPLVARYRGAALRPNWVEHEDYGDRYDDCMAAPFTLESSAAHLRETARQWSAAANDFTALVHSLPGSPEFNNRRFQEVSCARMIGHQLHSAACLLEVHSWRKRKILELALTPPCDIPCDEILSSLLDAEISNLESAQKLAAADSRLGFHGQSRTHQYSAESIAKKIEGIKQWAFPER
jgi:hypothetical protein